MLLLTILVSMSTGCLIGILVAGPVCASSTQHKYDELEEHFKEQMELMSELGSVHLLNKSFELWKNTDGSETVRFRDS